MDKHINDQVLGAVSPGSLAAGQICFANEGRFNSSFYNEPLTTYTVGGWDRDPLQELLEFYAPAVSVPEFFTYKAADILDSFLELSDGRDIRAMGARFAQLPDARLTDVVERLEEKGLTICVDRRAMEANPTAREDATDRLRRILLRSDLVRVIALHLASAINTGKTWNASADPDQDVQDELELAANTFGFRPNRVGYGSLASSRRSRAIRGGDKSGDFASAGWSDEQLGNFIRAVANTFSEARYRGASGLSSMLGDQVLMFFAEEGAGKDDPSNIKRFTGQIGGAPIWVYEQEFPHGVEITVAHKSKPKVTSVSGMRKFTISA